MNKPAIELNDEQRMLISWSQLYDSVYEHNECPPDFVIDYDDALDGWLLLQKDKRDREVNRRNFEKNNPKIANASEIFKKVNSWEELKIVENMNDNIAKAQKKMRMGYLKEKGEVHEQHMPDTRKEIMMLYNRKKGS